MPLKFILIAVFSCAGILSSFGQGGLKLVAEMKNPIVSKQEDLLTTLTLINHTGRKLLVHKNTAYGYLSLCVDDFCFEAEQNVKGKFIKMKERTVIDRFGAYDSTGVPWSEIYDTLNNGEKFLAAFNIKGYYSFDKGKYRMRYSFQLPDKNNLVINKIFSNWLYFEVKPKHLTVKY